MLERFAVGDSSSASFGASFDAVMTVGDFDVVGLNVVFVLAFAATATAVAFAAIVGVCISIGIAVSLASVAFAVAFALAFALDTVEFLIFGWSRIGVGGIGTLFEVDRKARVDSDEQVWIILRRRKFDGLNLAAIFAAVGVRAVSMADFGAVDHLVEGAAVFRYNRIDLASDVGFEVVRFVLDETGEDASD